MRSEGKAHGIPLLDWSAVQIEDRFWAPRLAVMRAATIRDVFHKFESRGGDARENFRRVAGGMSGGHLGAPWFDGLLYETITAASDFLAQAHDDDLDRRIDAYIEIFAAAQAVDPDGYLNTYTTLMCPEHRWGERGGNLLRQHDVYNAGCLIEAAVHHYAATRKLTLLAIAVRFADYMCRYMGPPPRKNIVAGHPLPERALVDLYRLFRTEPTLKNRFHPVVDEPRYLALARFWVDARGCHAHRASFPRYMGEYAQDHVPLVKQHEAVGHAVRATLVYDGLVNLGMEEGNREYLDAARRIWDSVAEKKLHVSGSVGADHGEEKFSYEYCLPNNAYLETCASVGLAIWSASMNRAFANACYIDVVERALYNGVLSGISLSGNTYFYQNPLCSKGDVHRWEWHECPCCPPMLLKAMARLRSFIYCSDGADLFVNLYVSGRVGFPAGSSSAFLVVETSYPWDGEVTFTVTSAKSTRFGLRLRIPQWCDSWGLQIDGHNPGAAGIENGYAVIERKWKKGDKVLLHMDMPVRRMEAHPYVAADRGLVAIQRGPILYCLESVDNPRGVDRVLPSDPAFTTEWRSDLLGGVVMVKGMDAEGRPFAAIPYHAWDNRAAGEMRVWLRQSGKDERDQNLSGWERKLYRPYRPADG